MNEGRTPKLIFRGEGTVKPNPMGRFVVGTVSHFGINPSSPQGRAMRCRLKKHLFHYLTMEMFERPEIRERFIQEVLEECGRSGDTDGRAWLSKRLKDLLAYYMERAQLELRSLDTEGMILPFNKQ